MKGKVVRKSATVAVETAQEIDLGEGSSISYLPECFSADKADAWFRTLESNLHWQRPEIFVRGRRTLQPRETFYIADPGLKPLKYSGYQPAYHTWDDFPLLDDIRKAVCEVLPGHAFNSCLINRYADGDSSVAWHSDNEKLFGIAPTIASLSLGAAREFLVRRKVKVARSTNEPSENRKSKKRSAADADVMGLGAEATVGDQQERGVSKHSFHLRNGDVLVMRGNMQRDWEHSIPRRKAVKGTRLSLTFRTVLEHDAG